MKYDITFILCTVSFLLVCCDATEVEDVIYLDLTPLRKGDITESSQIVTTDHRAISSGNASKIYCSNTTFPDDIFCDLSTQNRTALFKLQPVTTAIYFKFPHPTKSTAQCFASFKNLNDSLPSRLVYKSFTCYDSPELREEWMYKIERKIRYGEVKPLADVEVPESLKVKDVIEVEYEDRSTENLSFKCRNSFRKAQDMETESLSSVVFEFNRLVCISSAPPILPRREEEMNTVALEVTPQP